MRKIICLMSLLGITFLPSCSSGEEDITKSPFSFREPLTAWGAGSTEVQEYMDGYRQVSGSAYSMTFEGKDSETAYLYAFSSPGSDLCYAVVSFDLTLRETLLSWLRDNYSLTGSAAGNHVFTDVGHTTVITMTSDGEVYLTYRSQAATQ